MSFKLVFDTTDANTIADSHNVGAYIRASDGTLIDSVTIAGVDRLAVDSTLKDGAGNALVSTAGALHVNLVSPITVDVDLKGVYDVGTNPNPDSAGIIAHVRTASPDKTNQTFRSTGASPSSDNVNPANVHALDVNAFAMGWDGTGWDRLTATAGALDINIASSAIQLQVSDAALANTAIASASNSLNVANVAEDVVVSPLPNRKYLFIYNNGNRTAYIGATGVTASNGFPLPPGSVIELRAGSAIDIEWVSDNTNQQLRTLELA
jgi:hypothetical protein